jgi:hypothetical protein
MKAIILAVLAMFVTAVSNAVIAQEIEASWFAVERFQQVNLLCYKPWICSNTKTIMYDSATHKKLCTKRTGTWGVCIPAGGPIDSCNDCFAAPPKEICTCRLVPK